MDSRSVHSNDVAHSMTDRKLLEFVGNQNESAAFRNTFSSSTRCWVGYSKRAEVSVKLGTLMRESGLHDDCEEIVQNLITFNCNVLEVLVLVLGLFCSLKFERSGHLLLDNWLSLASCSHDCYLLL